MSTSVAVYKPNWADNLRANFKNGTTSIQLSLLSNKTDKEVANLVDLVNQNLEFGHKPGDRVFHDLLGKYNALVTIYAVRQYDAGKTNQVEKAIAEFELSHPAVAVIKDAVISPEESTKARSFIGGIVMFIIGSPIVFGIMSGIYHVITHGHWSR